MAFELFHDEFGDAIFPKIVQPCEHTYTCPRMYGNQLLQTTDPELDYPTFRHRVSTLSKKLLTEYSSCIHHSRHLSTVMDSCNRQLENLHLSLLKC